MRGKFVEEVAGSASSGGRVLSNIFDASSAQLRFYFLCIHSGMMKAAQGQSFIVQIAPVGFLDSDWSSSALLYLILEVQSLIS